MSKRDYIDISKSSQINKVYKKKHSKGKVARIIVLVLSIVFLLSGSGLVYYYSALDALNYKEIETDPTAPTSVDATEVPETSLLSSTKVLNILLFGQDAHAEGEEKFGRSDTTILLSVDNINKKLKLTSFQRDTYVTIPGYGENKLNAAFSLGGVALSIKTIEANFGIKVDKYAVVDFDSFREIIAALGGVDIELNLEEIEYINAQIDVNDQTSWTSFLEYDPSKKTQVMHLDGQQALWYARDRGCDSLGDNPDYSFSGDDWDRTARQRNLIYTIADSLKEASIPELVKVVNAVGPLITTNLKKSDITYLVKNIPTYLDYKMCEISLPMTGRWSYAITDDQQSVIAITDWEQTRYDLAHFVYEDEISKDNYNLTKEYPTENEEVHKTSNKAD